MRKYIIFLIISLTQNMWSQKFEWAKQMNGDIFPNGIIMDKNGDFIINGSFSNRKIYQDTNNVTVINWGTIGYNLIKIDGTGNVKWTKNLLSAESITCDDVGNIYATGKASTDTIKIGDYQFINHSSDFTEAVITKCNSKGEIIWAKAEGGNGDDYGKSVATDKDENCYFAGIYRAQPISFDSKKLENYDSYNSDVFVVKYDKNGKVLWAKNIGSNSFDDCNKVTIDKNGNCIITGTFDGHSLFFGETKILDNLQENSSDIYIIKLDNNGNLLWAKSAGGTNSDKVTATEIDNNNNCIISGIFSSASMKAGGYTLENNSQDYFNFIAQYDAQGNVKWLKNVKQYNTASVRSICIDNSGNYMLTGTYWIGDYFSPSLIILKVLNTKGTEIFSTTLGEEGHNSGDGIISDTEGNIYITGNYTSNLEIGETTLSTSFTSDAFIAKIKFDKTTTGFEELPVSSESIVKNYPNLFTKSTTFEFVLKSSALSSLNIYNVQGKLIESIVNQNLQPGDYKYTWIPGQINDGIYYYRFKSGNVYETGKMIYKK